MKTLRVIATILVYGPVVGMLGTITGMVYSFEELAQQGPRQEVLAYWISVALYSQAFVVFAFPIGVFLHGYVAVRTGVYLRKVWRLILASSILFCISNPVGLILGGVTIVLLLRLDTFNRMRRAEQTPVN